METPNFNLDKYQEYLNQKNQEYQQMLNTELETFKNALKEEQKNFFEQETKDFLNRMQEIKNSYFKTYGESMREIDSKPEGEIKERRKRMTEKRLDEFLDICNSQIKNFLQGFES